MGEVVFTGPARYVARSNIRYQELLTAAEQYTYQIPHEIRTGLLLKPLDAANHHVSYLRAIYGALNFIDKLHLPGASTIVDAGAGPGWLSEQLLLLGYHVILLEPSQDMLDIARLRIERAAAKWEIDLLARAEFVKSSIEYLPAHLDRSGIAQAVLFHEAWHHVIDEDKAAENVYELLSPGGQIAVLTEGRWVPGERSLEAGLDQEMESYGTLESPFTRDYMKFVLDKAGFLDINFYHAVNGLFHAEDGKKTIEEVAGDGHEKGWNNCIARRPGERFENALDPHATHARLELRTTERCGAGIWRVTIAVTNVGQTTWRADAQRGEGLVALGMVGCRAADLGEAEIIGRGRLPFDTPPGSTALISAEFRPDGAIAPYRASLVAEGSFWFSERLTIDLC